MFCVGKLFESIIKVRLEWILEHNPLLNPLSFAFWRDIRPMESVPILTSSILTEFTHNYKTLAVILDLELACEHVNISLQLSKLSSYNISSKYINIINAFFRDRQIFLRDHSNGTLHGPLYLMSICKAFNHQ